MLSKFLYSFLSFPYYIIYAVIFFLMVFLGEEALLIIGALTHFGVIDFWDAFFFAFLGTIAGDIFWFKIGGRYGENFILKYGKWFFITPERFQRIEGMINKNSGIFVFLSKFMYNLNHISLVAAGAIKFPFKKFIRLQVFISLIWVFAFMWLGHAFAYNLAKLKHDVTLFTILVLVVFVGFILIEKFIEKLIKWKIFDRLGGNGK
ncbi:MAG: VTT domain-containing protein [bacterium]